MKTFRRKKILGTETRYTIFITNDTKKFLIIVSPF